VSAPEPDRRVLLVTCAALPDGEPGGRLLVEALARRGVAARWVRWDDPAVDWTDGLVCVRATWDYDARRDQFLAWARSVPRLLNGAAVFAWNTDKAYLVGLGAGVPVVPTVLAEGEEELPAAIAEACSTPDGAAGAVVKPRVGAGGRGVTVFLSSGLGTSDMADGGPLGLDESGLGPGPWIVQPLVGSVRTEGEASVYVLGGEVVSQFAKQPAAGEIRVHEEYGGRTVAVAVTDEAADLARRTVLAAERALDCGLDYARVDCMRLADGTLAVSELEVTEPGLYLDVADTNAEPFAGLVSARLEG
jgi:glutathione synthase/RimK-type ligase-like ATP-grasp enzyme